MPKSTETNRAYIRYANGLTETFRTSMNTRDLLRYARAKAAYDRTAVKIVRLNNAPAFGGGLLAAK